MKKALKSVVALVFCFVLLSSTVVFSSAVGAVKSLKASGVTYNSATLTWSKVKNADGYQVRPYVDKKYGSIVDNKKTTTYKAKLTPGKSYTFYVRAYDKKLKGLKTVTEYSSWAKVAVKALPTQVKSLKGTQSGTSVKLTWNKVAGATGYTVQQYKSKKWTTIKTVTANSYTVTKQKYQTTQQFRVCAYSTYKKKNYAGPYSATVKVTIATPAPAKVGSFKATQSGKNVNLTWKAVSGASGYEVQQYVGKAWKTIKTLNATSLTVKNQAYQSTQQFRVRAYKMYDKIRVNGSYSSTVKITIATPAPAKVSSLKATQSAKNVTLTWKAVSGAAGYEVQQYVSGKWKTIKTLSATSHKVTNQAYQSTQQFRVRAYKMYDKIRVNGSYSSTVSITIATPAPAAVTNFKAAQNGNSVNLTWTAVSGAAGYEVQQYVSNKWKSIKTVTTNSYTVPSLTYGSTYKFRVCAYKMYDSIKSSSAYTSEASVTITVAKPTSFKPGSVSTTTAKLTWTAKTGATGYEVYNYSTGKTTTVTTNSISLSSLKAGTSYKFKVRSYAGSYKSAYTSDITFSTVPAAVSNFKAADVTDTTAKISWTGATGCTSYQLEKSEDAGKTWTNCSNSANTSVALSSLKSNTAYKLRVRGYLNDAFATRYGAWTELSVKTKLSAPVLATQNNTASKLNFSWNAVSGAASYVLECYDSTSYEWKKATDANTVITATSCSIDAYSNEINLYRVYAVSADNTAGLISNTVNAVPAGLTLTKSNFTATVSWTDLADPSITSYEILRMPLNDIRKAGKSWEIIDLKTPSEITNSSYTVYLTPGAINSYKIVAQPSKNVIAFFDVDASGLVIDNTDVGKNAQLLYLINAVNKTKLETTTVNVSKNSETSLNMYYMKFKGTGVIGTALETMAVSMGGKLDLLKGEVTFDSEESIKKFMSSIDDSSSDDINGPVVTAEAYTFTEGKTADSKIYLYNFIDPTGKYYTSALKPDVFISFPVPSNPSEWKKGLSSINTTKNADGTHTVTITINKESFGNGTGTDKPFYHNHFISSLGSLAENSSDKGTTIKSKVAVGATKITAKIAADGRLISYSVAMPLDMDVTTIMSNDATDGMGTFEMQVKTKGTENVNYTFVR